MDAMAAQLRATYQEKETEELIELGRQTTLTDTAYAVLEEVLVARGVDIESVKSQRARNAEQEKLEEEAARRLASIPKRLLAKLIDTWGIPLLFIIPLAVLERAVPLLAPEISQIRAVFVLAFCVHFLFGDGLTGQSVGKRMMKIRVIQYGTNKPCTLGQSFSRNLSELFIFDWLFALGKERMRLGDMIAGTQVVNAR